MKKTKVFDRLPSISGVHFDGFEEIKIESREKVKKDIEDFINYCKKEAKGAAARVILGEWGEGKTEAYYRYIYPSAVECNDYAFFLSASTLAHCYENEKTMALLKTTPLTALRLLVAIFKSVRDEAKDSKIKKMIPSPETYTDAENYMEDVLDALLKKERTKKIFIFIDEFEELLLNRKALREIISGIKETINGVYGAIHENGVYSGAIHFFISCTPDAYYKLQVHEETSLIFGGLGRRAKVIGLPEIRKKEGIDYLYGLLKYSYNDKLPNPFPIENLGVFNLLLRISHGNLGNLTSLYTNMFNNLREGEYLHVLDYEHLLNFLEKEQIFVYGGQTPCIERDIYYRILRYLKDQSRVETGELCTNLFRLFIGEIKPFAIEEIEKRTSKNKKQIQSAINIINENIRSKEKVERAIIKIAPLKDGKTIEDVLKFFEEYIEIDKIKNKKSIHIERHSEMLDEFVDRITYYSLENGNMVEKIFLPFDEMDIRIFFEDEISHEKAIELRNGLRKIRSDNIYYIASDAILAQIFPAPVPKGLEFITNRELRLRFWRNISRDLSSEYDKNMLEAFLRVLERSEIYDFEERKDYSSYSILQLIDRKTETSLRVLFYPINGDVKGEDIEKISNILSTNKKIHLVILIYSGEITVKSQEKISNKELGREGKNIILDVHLHPTLSKRILCSHNALAIPNNGDFDDALFKAICEEIVTQELMLDKKIMDWIKEQEKRGLVVSQISTSARSLKEFSDALKFYINYMDEANSPDEIYKKNMNEVLKFRKYGTKTGFLPSDFESSNKIEELSIDLCNNGFLKKVDGVYKVVEHPIESKILQIIEKERKILVADLQDYFIIKERKKKVFEDVYLNILEYKGRIKREKSFYVSIDSEELYKELKEKYKRYKETIKREEFKAFGHFYVVKEHNDNLIMLNDFDNFLTRIFDVIDSLKTSPTKNIFLQKISLCNRLIEQFNTEFAHAIKGAFRKGKEIIEATKNKIIEIEEDITFITANSKKWLRFDFDREHIKEYENAIQIYNTIIKTYEKRFSREELNDIIESISDKKIFKFDKSIDDAYYFNIKLFKLQQLHHQLFKKIEEINKFIERIKPLFEEINESKNDLDSKLKIKDIPEKYRISNEILKALKSVQIVEEVELHSYRASGIKLRDIEKNSKEIIKELRRRIDSIINVVNSLDNLINKEKEFLSSLDECINFGEKIKAIFDTDEFGQLINSFSDETAEIIDRYDGLAKHVRIKEEEINKKIIDIEEKFSAWENSLKDIKNIFRDEWNSYKDKTIKFTKRVKEMLVLLSKEHKIETEEIDENIRLLLQRIDLPVDELNDKISSLEELKKEIKDIAMKIAGKFVTSDEAKVLDVLYSKKDERLVWISHEELLKETIRKYKMSEGDINNAIENLISKKYILKGFSLSL